MNKNRAIIIASMFALIPLTAYISARITRITIMDEAVDFYHTKMAAILLAGKSNTEKDLA